MAWTQFFLKKTAKKVLMKKSLDIFCGSPICKFSTVGAFLCNLYYSSVTIRPLLLAEFSHQLEEIPQSRKKIQFFLFRSVNFLTRFQPMFSPCTVSSAKQQPIEINSLSIRPVLAKNSPRAGMQLAPGTLRAFFAPTCALWTETARTQEASKAHRGWYYHTGAGWIQMM